MKISFQNKYLLLIGFSWLLISKVWACGCYTYDYNSIQTKSYLGLFYSQRYENGYNKAIASPSLNSLHRVPTNIGTTVETDKDYGNYRMAELRYNHNFGNWLNIAAVLPFVDNKDFYNTIYYTNGTIGSATHHENGIGDLFVSAMLVKQKEYGSAKHTFKYGGGIYLPTGKHTVVDKDGNFVDPSHQPGRGTVNYLLQVRHFMISKEKYGVSSSISYLFNSKGKKYPSNQPFALQYTYGNQFTAFSNLFYKVFINSINIVPKIGFYYENVQKDLLNDYEQKNTGDNLLAISSGLDIKVKDLMIQSVIRIPVSQNLNGLQQETKWILNLGMIYAF